MYMCRCHNVALVNVHLLIFVEAEREQFEARIDQLTSGKEDLLTRLQCCEEELKLKDECETALRYITN